MKEEKSLLSWSYDDSKNRSQMWYMIAGTIAIWLIIWGFITGQFGMSIVIMLIIGIMFFIENNSEDHVGVEIQELWIKIQNNFYDYGSISSFKIVYSGDRAIYLRIFTKKRGLNILNIKIDTEHARQARGILVNYIKEDEQWKISMLERMIHLLKL